MTDIDLIKSKWNEILDFVKNEYDLTDVSFKTWIEPLVVDHIEKTSNGLNLHIIVPGSVYKNTIEFKQYNLYIDVAIEEITKIKCISIFEEKKEENIAPNRIINVETKEVQKDILAEANLNPKYTFDSFVVGSNNNIAHAAALAVAESPGEIYNPLFIYGGVGLGKTHLMHSIAHFILEKNPKSRIIYVTSETFTNEVIESIRKNTTSDLRNKYRNIDVLLIDDIQFIIGKESTQEEFFHTFNALYEIKKQIIISSDKPPKSFSTLEERLRSRFECGLIVDISSPDYETRMAILRKKEESDGLNIDNEVIQYIASNIKSNIRELEGALTKIVAMSKLSNNREINVSLAQEVLTEYISPKEPTKVTPELICLTVADHFHLNMLDLAGQKRNKEIAYPRQIAMYLCRTMIDVTLQQIGAVLGGRDHTTIIHGADKIADMIRTDEEVRITVDIIKNKISPQSSSTN